MRRASVPESSTTDRHNANAPGPHWRKSTAPVELAIETATHPSREVVYSPGLMIDHTSAPINATEATTETATVTVRRPRRAWSSRPPFGCGQEPGVLVPIVHTPFRAPSARRGTQR